MKVFASWSGVLSLKIAEQLKNFVESCIQSVEVFLSNEDIKKGDLWNERLSRELQNSDFGVVCLTPENIAAPWVHFEAGALSKHLNSKVSALVADISISEIEGPLKSFQSTRLESKDVYKLLQSINHSLEDPLPEEKLKRSFEAFSTEFFNNTQHIIKAHRATEEGKENNNLFDQEKVLEEILQILRMQESRNAEKGQGLLQEELKTRKAEQDLLVERAYRNHLKAERVRKFILERAAGVCDLCGCEGPKDEINNRPILQTHHIQPLKEDGSSAPSNLIALCPNCHAMVHASQENGLVRKQMKNAIKKYQAEDAG